MKMTLNDYIEKLKLIAVENGNIEVKFVDGNCSSHMFDVVDVENYDVVVLSEYSVSGNDYYIDENSNLEDCIGSKMMQYTDNKVKNKYVVLNMENYNS